MSQCFNIVYLAGGFPHTLNDVLHAAERERLGVPVFELAKDHCILPGAESPLTYATMRPITSEPWGYATPVPTHRLLDRGPTLNTGQWKTNLLAQGPTRQAYSITAMIVDGGTFLMDCCCGRRSGCAQGLESVAAFARFSCSEFQIGAGVSCGVVRRSSDMS